MKYAIGKCKALKQAASDAKTFGHATSSNYTRILLYIEFIELYDKQIASVLSQLHKLVEENEDTRFVQQIHLIESFRGVGSLSAVSLMAEIGDFSAFRKPKQLFTYFGLDPAVKQSGKFEGTQIKMSKRGSAVARRVIHTMALVSISKGRNRNATNPVIRDSTLKSAKQRQKMWQWALLCIRSVTSYLPFFGTRRNSVLSRLKSTKTIT